MANPWLRRVLYAALVPIVGPATYFAAAFGLGAVAVTPFPERSPDGATVDIAIVSNGVHTDIVMPAVTETIDWRQYFPPAAAPTPVVDPRFVAIGWGHRGFYLNTPTWAELKLSTALSAILGIGRTVLHVTFLDEIPPKEDVIWKRVSQDGYQRLVSHVQGSIAELDARMDACIGGSEETPQNTAEDCPDRATASPIPGHSYYGNDAFFEASGHYHLFYTCNSWTRDGLAAAGLTVPLWSPFAGAIMRLSAPVDSAHVPASQ